MSKLTSSPFSVIIISQVNPETNGTGWKDDIEICANKNGEDFIACIERIAFLQNDLITGYHINETEYFEFFNSSDLFHVKPFFRNKFDGIIQTVEMTNDKAISHKTSSSFAFELNKKLSYFIYITDKKLQFVSSSPDVLPRSDIFFKAESGSTFLYLKAIRHEKLNLPNRPCEPDPDYSIADCIEESIIIKAGCQPHRGKVSVEGLPVCNNVSMLSKYDEDFYEMVDLSRKELFDVSNCILPCSFMEYKVSFRIQAFVSKDFTKISKYEHRKLIIADPRGK